MRGMKWTVGASNHGCWLGSYEADKQHVFQELVKPGQVIYDIGANVGFYTLLASRLVTETGRVFAFEPLPENLNFLRAHLSMNEIRNVKVVEGAVGASNGKARFEEHQSNSMGKLSQAGTLEVSVYSLDSLLADAQLNPPHIIKIDVEGGEEAVLLGASKLIQTHKPTILLATHGPGPHEKCLRLLKDWGFNVQPINSDSIEKADELLATC
jgi:FkbM family methyltransferase